MENNRPAVFDISDPYPPTNIRFSMSKFTDRKLELF